MYPGPPRKLLANSSQTRRAATRSDIQRSDVAGSDPDLGANRMWHRIVSPSRCRWSGGGSDALRAQRSKQAVNGSLQHEPVRAQLAGFSERLVSRGFERDDAAGEFPPPGLHVRYL
jgi:hypothetical protein